MENDVFQVAVSEDWIPQEQTKDKPGQDLFKQEGTDFAFYQSILGFKGGRVPNPKKAAEETLKNRIDAMRDKSTIVRSGEISLTERDWGWLAVSDFILNETVYGIAVCYAFPEVLLLHWLTGPVGEMDAVRSEIVKIMASVAYNENKPDPA